MERTRKFSENPRSMVTNNRRVGRASPSSSRSVPIQGRICAVCGDAGNIDELLTCTACRTASEHKYCAEDPPSESGADWYCETCRQGQGSSVQPRSLNVPLPYRSSPVAWKGTFVVHEIIGDMIVELAGYLPLQVSAKLYNAIQTLPTELETRTVPRSVAWPKLFKTGSPSFEDIGVIFLPSNRRSRKCTSILRLLDSGRHALKIKMSSHTELVVYSSQVLKMKCQRLGGELFLWGLFWKHKMRSDSKRVDEVEGAFCSTPQHLCTPQEEPQPVSPTPTGSAVSADAREENSPNEPRVWELSNNQVPVEAITTLAALNNNTECKRVAGRVVRMWCASNLRTREALAMKFVLLDSQGTAIEGQMLLEHYQCVSQYFVEGAIYEFEGFQVENCPIGYCTVSHKFRLNVTNDTTIKSLPHSSSDFPFHYFEFVRLEDIGTSITGKTKVVDIIGRLAAIEPVITIQTEGQSIHIQPIYLINERNFPVEITLWDNFFHVLPLATLAEVSKQGPVVLACNSLRLNPHRGPRALKTCSGTRFYFDQDLSFIADFRARNLQGRYHPITTVAAQPLTVQNSISSSRVMNSQPLRVTIAELLGYDGNRNTNKIFQCVAQITAVNNPHTWFYDSCFNCQKKVHKDRVHQLYWCRNCREWHDRPVLWYCLSLQVADNTGSAQYMFFGKHAEQIVGAPADQVRYEQNPYPLLAPPSIRALIRKKMLFTVMFKAITPQQRHVSFRVLGSEELPPDQQLSTHPAHPRTDIAESSGHQSDKCKRKAEETLPEPAKRSLTSSK